MKKRFFCILFLFANIFLYAEKYIFRTGDALSLSFSDYFYPIDVSVSGNRCSITSVKKIDKDLWCLSLTTLKNGQGMVPVVFDYYIKNGDELKMKRYPSINEVTVIKIINIDWNQIELEIK